MPAPRLKTFSARCLAALLFGIVWCSAAAAEPVAVDSVAALARQLRQIGFLIPDHHLARLDAVARTRIAGPGAAAAWREKVPFRQSVFYRLALSAVLQANEALIAMRARVQSMVPARIGLVDRAWLTALSSDYGVAAGESMPISDLKAAILLRLDALPPSLVIAKGALDSGWLPSRHGRPDGPVFGRWTLGRVTAAGTDDAAFRAPRAALDAYMRHLNTDPSFAAMHNARAALRREGQLLDGHSLAVYLAPSLGRAAVQHLQQIIRRNSLKRVDTARLAAGLVIEFQRVDR
jgi:Bax protein